MECIGLQRDGIPFGKLHGSRRTVLRISNTDGITDEKDGDHAGEIREKMLHRNRFAPRLVLAGAGSTRIVWTLKEELFMEKMC